MKMRDTNFVGILFNAEEDFGRWDPDSISKKFSVDDITDAYQWVEDEDNSKIIISTLGEADPNNSSSSGFYISMGPKTKTKKSRRTSLIYMIMVKIKKSGRMMMFIITMVQPPQSRGLQGVIRLLTQIGMRVQCQEQILTIPKSHLVIFLEIHMLRMLQTPILY